MSMISAQIDELRKLADGQAPYRDARAVMLEAADTIWELRDDLQRANAENAKLREERDMYRDLVGMMDHPDVNSKLRELVRDMFYAVHPVDREKVLTNVAELVGELMEVDA